MRQPLRCVAILAATGIAVGGLSSCGLGTGTTFEDDAALSGKVTAVRLDNPSGGVTVEGVSDGGGLSVHRRVEYRGDKPTGPSRRIENGVLVLGGCGDHCSVDYTVEVPAGTPVSGHLGSGSIRLTDVGAVEVSTSSGRIELHGVTGSVEAKTSNGRITGKGIEDKQIQAQTSNGRINLAPGRPADVHAQTSNGDITLTVPQARYRVNARAANGDENIGVTDDPSGPFELGLKTSNGDITVRNS